MTIIYASERRLRDGRTRRLTDLGLASLGLQRAPSITDEERKVEQVLDRLSKVVRVDDELEEIDLAGTLENPFEL